MSEICSCEDFSLGNLGAPNCVPETRETRKLIFVPYFKKDGTVTKIATSDTLNAAFWSSHLQQYNSGTLVASDARWYLTPDLNNIINERAETVFQDNSNGTKTRYRSGNRSFTADILKAKPETKKKLDGYGCSDLGFYIVDASDNLIGNGGTSGELRPFRVQKGSFDTQYFAPSDNNNTVEKVTFMFDVGIREYDGDIKMIKAESMTVVPSDLNPLIDLYGSIVGTPTTTGFVMNLKTSFGDMFSPIGPPGFVAADFVLTERLPTPGAITITSVAESVPASGGGINYTFVIPAQTSGDTLKLTIKKNGFDGESVETVVITIP